MPFRELTDDELSALVQLDVGGEIDSLATTTLGLKEYSAQSDANLDAAYDALVEKTLAQGPAVAALHQKVKDTAAALETVGKALEGFSDLGVVVNRIQTVGDDVIEIQTKVANRKAIDDKLGGLLQRAIIPPEAIKALMRAETVNDKFVLNLRYVSKSSRLLRELGPRHPITLELLPTIHTITLLVSQKTRAFLLEKIAQLSKPKTNIAILQQNVLLKFKSVMTFLLLNNPAVAQEVKDTYVQSLSGIFHRKTKLFLAKLVRLEKPFLTAKDLVTTTRPNDRNNDPGYHFSTRGRDNIIANWTAPIVIPHVDEEKGRSHSFESLFRSMHLLLMDVIASEFMFTFEFFSDKTLYLPIFQKVVTLYSETMQTLVPSVHDHISLAFCIKLTTLIKHTMNHRRIPCLTGYCESLLVLLWTQLSAVVKANLTALSQLQRLPDKIVGPAVQPVTCKFAEFVGVLHSTLVSEVDGADPVSEHGDRLKFMEAQLTALTLEMYRVLLTFKGSERQSQLFLAANLAHVHAAWLSYDLNRSAEYVAKIESWLAQAKSALVQLLVDYYLPNFVEVITCAESKLRTIDEGAKMEASLESDLDAGDEGGLVQPDSSEHEKRRAVIDENAVLQCAEQFGQSWESRVPLACKEVVHGTDPMLATDLTSRFVMQVAIYSERLKKIISRCWLNPPCRKSMVPNRALLSMIQLVLEREGIQYTAD
ncbi:Vacuolar protein sorting-associated protein 52 A [Diplonema papillatum]|nr:Vacuolar protein sorting-associated protein 52 A [Diplonema papillatum]